MTLQETLRAKAELLNEAEKDFLAALEATEKSIFSKILTFIKNLTSRDNKLVKEKLNKRKANALSKEIIDIIKNSTLPVKVDAFIKNFDALDRLNFDAYDLLNVKVTNLVKAELGVLKGLQVETITRSLLNEANLAVNYTDRIRDIIIGGVGSGAPIKNIESAIKNYVKGAGNGGKLKRYARQIAFDAINQYDGQINDFIGAANKLDGFMYINPLVRDSRKNCIDMVNSTGPFAKFAVATGVYRTADRAKIIRAARKGKGSGFNPNVTPETFAQYRMGFNCNHVVIYGRLEDLT